MTSIVVEIVVSSAYIMNLNKLLEFAISFTYIIKKVKDQVWILGGHQRLLLTFPTEHHLYLHIVFCLLDHQRVVTDWHKVVTIAPLTKT